MSRARRGRRLDPDAPLRQNAGRILARRVAKLYSFSPTLPDEQATAALHEMRIAAKRLRYTLELFACVFGEAGAECIEQVKAIQEALGVLHDADVRMDVIVHELTTISDEEIAVAKEGAIHSREAGDPRIGLLPLLARQAKSRRANYEEFAALWARLNDQGLHTHLTALSAGP